MGHRISRVAVPRVTHYARIERIVAPGSGWLLLKAVGKEGGFLMDHMDATMGLNRGWSVKHIPYSFKNRLCGHKTTYGTQSVNRSATARWRRFETNLCYTTASNAASRPGKSPGLEIRYAGSTQRPLCPQVLNSTWEFVSQRILLETVSIPSVGTASILERARWP